MIDSHAHLSLYPLDVDALIKRAIDSNVKTIIDVCIDIISLEKSLLLQKKYPIYTSCATPPQDVFSEDFFKMTEKYIDEKKIIAIGETGLDYYHQNIEKEKQTETFFKYLNLAKIKNLPLIIHCREAFFDLIPILKNNFFSKKIIFHCFTGTIEENKEIIKNNWYISFSGIITFKNASKLQECVKITPLKNIFVETDTPYLAPQSQRGKPNEPSFIIEIVKMIAKIKKVHFQEVVKNIAINTKKLFGIDII